MLDLFQAKYGQLVLTGQHRELPGCPLLLLGGSGCGNYFLLQVELGKGEGKGWALR